MARKAYKIKRNMQIHRYRSPLSIALHTLSTIVIVGGLALIGWSAYGPISTFLAGTTTASTPAVSNQPASSNTPPVVEQASSAPEPTPQQKPALDPALLRGVYLPPSVLADNLLLDRYLDDLVKQEYNALLFDLKNTSGQVLYQSTLLEAAPALAEDAFDLAALCQKLSDRGITPIGRLHAFRDPIAANAHRSMSVKYMDTQMQWLDNAADKGGKPWLNPYSKEACAYILALGEESAQMGVRLIMLDSVSLPTAYALEYASFGSDASTISVQQILSTFVRDAQARVQPHDAQTILYLSGVAVLGTQDRYYGGNPLALAGEQVMIGMMPSQFGDAYTEPAPYPQETGSDTFSLRNPITTPYTTLDQLCTAIAPGLKEKKVTALLQGATATGAYQNNKVYTAAEIDEQLRALQKHNISAYALFSPDGIYPIFNN